MCSAPHAGPSAAVPTAPAAATEAVALKFRSKEQARYAKLIAGAVRPGPPLLAGAAAGLGKTHGYTLPLAQAVSSGKRIAVALSTRQLVTQYLDSDAVRQAQRLFGVTVCALLPRRDFDSEVSYREHRDRALAADILVVTHAAACIDSFHPGYAGLRQRDVVVFDEADLLADAADLRSTFCIPAQTLKTLNVADRPYEEACAAVRKRASDPEDKAAAAVIAYALANPANYKKVGKDEEGALYLKHDKPGRMLKPLVAECPRCIFTSGTLQVRRSVSAPGDFTHFSRALGLRSFAAESCHIDPEHHGELVVLPANRELTLEEKAQRILAAPRPALVLTTSHETTRKLSELCLGATWRQPGEPLQEALARCPDDGIFIAAGAWSGLDEPRLRWKTVAIPTTPYLRPITLDGKQVNHFSDNQTAAIRRTNQGLHRGLRTPDAKCTLLLLDDRSCRAAMRTAIPARFKVEWESFEEGGHAPAAPDGAHDRYEARHRRSKHLREAAFKYHGMRCAHPGCTATDRDGLDVHHLRPISEGLRDTTLLHVQVLCAYHHRLAHAEMRRQSRQARGIPQEHTAGPAGDVDSEPDAADLEAEELVWGEGADWNQEA